MATLEIRMEFLGGMSLYPTFWFRIFFPWSLCLSMFPFLVNFYELCVFYAECCDNVTSLLCLQIIMWTTLLCFLEREIMSLEEFIYIYIYIYLYNDIVDGSCQITCDLTRNFLLNA